MSTVPTLRRGTARFTFYDDDDVTRSDQPKPPAVAIVRQNGLSSASSRASVAVTPVSRQIWWIQVVGGRPLARLHSCEGRSPSLPCPYITFYLTIESEMCL